MHKVRENKTQKTKIRVDQSRCRLAANNRWKIMKNWLYAAKTKSAFIGNRIEILFMTLSRSIFLSNFKYSACAFLPTQHFPLSSISSKTIGKPKICEYLNVWNLETVLADIASLVFPFSLGFTDSTCWLRKIHKKCSRGFRLKARNFNETIVYQITMKKAFNARL